MSSRINQELYDQASSMMSSEQIQQYKEMGEKMYNSIDFTTSEVLDNTDSPIAESLAYISEAIKSGLHISYLEENEIEVLRQGYGEEWFKRFGYECFEKSIY
jgi:hypothetical protein